MSSNHSASPSSDSDSESDFHLLNNQSKNSESAATQLFDQPLLPHPHVHYEPSSLSSTPAPALTGRAHQRYDSLHRRLICGAVPFAIQSDGSVRLLCIRGRDSPLDDFIFPKGGWEDFESEVECAHRECLEEAGCKGIMVAHIGECLVQSAKGKLGRLSMFLMQLTTEFESWSDQHRRERKWLTFSQAEQSISRTEMQEMLRRAQLAIQQLQSMNSDQSATQSKQHVDNSSVHSNSNNHNQLAIVHSSSNRS